MEKSENKIFIELLVISWCGLTLTGAVLIASAALVTAQVLIGG